MVNPRVRRLAAGAVVVALVGLVASDACAGGTRNYWAREPLTASIVANLLVVGVTALIVDEVIARRQRKAHEVSVGAQAVIVYTQTRWLFNAVLAFGGPDTRSDIEENLRSLANMLLVASSAFFDDQPARRFLVETQEFAASIVEALSASPVGPLQPPVRDRLAAAMARLDLVAEPLVRRIPSDQLPPSGTPAAHSALLTSGSSTAASSR
jgi:hypothetical protein